MICLSGTVLRSNFIYQTRRGRGRDQVTLRRETAWRRQHPRITTELFRSLKLSANYAPDATAPMESHGILDQASMSEIE